MRKFAQSEGGNRRQSGYGLIFAALGMVALLGAAGLSVDMGYLRYQRRLLQSAADSAALAGAAQLGNGGSNAQAVIAAKNDSQLNGFQDGSGNIDVTVTPTTINGNTKTIQVQVKNVYPTFFMRIFGASLRSVTVSTTATAQYLGGLGCIYALTGGGGINVTGSVNVPNCNVLSNQNIAGGGSITAAATGAHGTSSIAGTPPVITGTQRTSDPLSFLTAPGAPGGACPTIDWKATNNTPAGTRTITPGKYCGITFEGGFSQPVTFNPGNYYIIGGLSFHGTGNVNGTGGVFFYISSGSVSFGNSQRIRLVAPTGGTRPGILMFQPTSNTSAATVNGSTAGGGSYLEGGLYFPNASLSVNGAASAAATPALDYMLLVAKTLNLNTNVNFPSNYAALPNHYSPVRTATLIQ